MCVHVDALIIIYVASLYQNSKTLVLLMIHRWSIMSQNDSSSLAARVGGKVYSVKRRKNSRVPPSLFLWPCHSSFLFPSPSTVILSISFSLSLPRYWPPFHISTFLALINITQYNICEVQTNHPGNFDKCCGCDKISHSGLWKNWKEDTWVKEAMPRIDFTA